MSEIEAVDFSHIDTCRAVANNIIAVSAPVTVTPFAHIETTNTRCYGEPIVVPVPVTPCTCFGPRKCSFVITQRLCVSIPIQFGATTRLDDTYAACSALGADTNGLSDNDLKK